MSILKYPNLDTGYATISGRSNNWRTEVRSMLCRMATNDEAYLTHECRAERVNAKQIFNDKLYEFAMIKTWLGNGAIRSGSYNYGIGSGLPNSVYEMNNELSIEVDCTPAKVKIFSFDEALEVIKKPQSGRYFLKIDYAYDGENWVIYAPARYVNFPNARTEGRYLQPISGYTLFYNGDRFVITYVAAHITEDACNIEFIAREPIPFIQTKVKTGWLRRYSQFFSPLTKKLLRTDEFWKRYVVKGEVTLFKYE